jgi:hypothetical protein
MFRFSLAAYDNEYGKMVDTAFGLGGDNTRVSRIMVGTAVRLDTRDRG